MSCRFTGEVCAGARPFSSSPVSPLSLLSLLSEQTVNLRCHDEVAFAEAIDRVRPQSNIGFAPAKQNVWVMSLLFGKGPDAVDKIESLLEIGEAEFPANVVLVHHIPVAHTRVELFEFLATKRGCTAAARNACLVG